VFKKGDLVIYTYKSGNYYYEFDVEPLIQGNIYKISHYNQYNNVCFAQYAGFGGSGDHGYYAYKCKKIINLTDGLKFKIIKQKLGVRDECQKK